MRALRCAPILLLTLGSAASAHGLAEPAGSPLLAWSFEPWAVLSLATVWIWYGLGMWRLSTEVDRRRILTAGRMVAFILGFGTLAIALLSPIDTLGEEIFWLHMVQHLLLTLVAPPLLVWSRPTVVFLWAFPRPVRKGVARAWNGIGLSRTVRALMHPLVVWLLFTGIFLGWHMPGPFQFALDHEAVHDLEHFSFFVTALMFWSVVIDAGRHRLGYGGRLLFLVSNGVLTGFPGALMVLAPRVLYPIQALRSAQWGLSGLEDQQLAGAVMWVCGGLVYLLAGSWLFVRWLDDADRGRSARVYRVASVAALVLAPLLLAGCDDQRRQPANLFPSRGDASRGLHLIRGVGCGNCHTIPGIRGADGVVGPPLEAVGRRVYLAGVLRNTPDNMVLWLRKPQAVVPGNAMPDTGLSERDARDVAAYLASLD